MGDFLLWIQIGQLSLLKMNFKLTFFYSLKAENGKIENGCLDSAELINSLNRLGTYDGILGKLQSKQADMYLKVFMNRFNCLTLTWRSLINTLQKLWEFPTVKRLTFDFTGGWTRSDLWALASSDQTLEDRTDRGVASDLWLRRTFTGGLVEKFSVFSSCSNRVFGLISGHHFLFLSGD